LRETDGRSRRRAAIPDRVWARAVDRCAPGDYAISSPEFGDIRAVRSETDLNWPIPARRGPVVPGLGATVATRTLGAKSSAIRAYRSRRADVSAPRRDAPTCSRRTKRSGTSSHKDQYATAAVPSMPSSWTASVAVVDLRGEIDAARLIMSSAISPLPKRRATAACPLSLARRSSCAMA
jgi:hypothetical protein